MRIRWREVGPGSGPRHAAGRDPIREAIEGCAALREIAARAHETGRPALLLVNDPDRSTATAPALEAIDGVRRTIPGAHADRPWPILVATGTHAWPEDARARHEAASIRGRVGPVAWHDAWGELESVGGHPFHPLVARAGALVAIGSCEPHYFAGVTGPHKTIGIGALGRDAIEANHRKALSAGAEGLRLDGNPVHEGIEAILRALAAAGKRLVGVAEVLRGEEVAACAAGEPLAALREVLPAVEAIYLARVPAPVDLIVARVAGPLGRTFYQADKAIKNVEACVRDGGALVLSAPLSGGVGPDRFVRVLRETRDLADVVGRVEAGYTLGDHKAVRLRRLMDPRGRGVRVIVAGPGLDPRHLEGTGIEVAPSEEAALQVARARFAVPVPRDLRGLIVEDAGHVTIRPGSRGSGARPDSKRRRLP